ANVKSLSGPAGPADCGPWRKPWESEATSRLFPAPAGATESIAAVDYLFRPCRGSVFVLLLYPMAYAMGHILPPLRGFKFRTTRGRVAAEISNLRFAVHFRLRRTALRAH